MGNSLAVLIPLALFVAAMVRAAGRLCLMRWLQIPAASVRVGAGPPILRWTTRAGVGWTVGILPLPFVRARPAEEASLEPGPLWKKGAVALAGPIALYLAGAVIAATYLFTAGEERETNVVDVIEGGGAAQAREVGDGHDPSGPHGLKSGDQITSIDGHPTPDGESVRRFESWTEMGEESDAEALVTVLRQGASRSFVVSTRASRWSRRLDVIPRVEHRQVGALEAARGGALFPGSQGSVIRWLAQTIVPRVRLQVSEYPIGSFYAPPWSPSPLLLADLLGLAAALLLCPWPGFDGGALLLLAYEGARRRRPPPWLEDLFVSPAWGVSMAVAAVIISLSVTFFVMRAAFAREPHALADWSYGRLAVISMGVEPQGDLHLRIRMRGELHRSVE